MDKAWDLYGTPANGLTQKLNACLSSTPLSFRPLPLPLLLFVGVRSEVIPFQGDRGSLPLAASSRNLLWRASQCS